MATPLGGLVGGPRFGVLGVTFGASSGTKNGTISASSSATVTVYPPVRTVIATIGMSARTSVIPIYATTLRLSSKASVNPVAVIAKTATISLSSKATAKPVFLAAIKLSSKAT